MSGNNQSAVHWSFWLIGVVCLLWNCLGAMAYLSEFDTNAVAAMDEFRRSLIDQRPAWATAAFAIAVWGGALGCLVLLLRKSFAFYLLAASLLGVVVQMTYNYTMAGNIDSYGPGGHAMSAMILGVALFLVFYTKYAERNGWVV